MVWRAAEPSCKQRAESRETALSGWSPGRWQNAAAKDGGSGARSTGHRVVREDAHRKFRVSGLVCLASRPALGEP
jgi:hypothetical protein